MDILVTVRGENPVISLATIIAHNQDQEGDIKFGLTAYEDDLFAFFEEPPAGTPLPKFPRDPKTKKMDYDNIWLIPEQTFFLLSLISQTDALIEFRKKVILQVREVRASISSIKESVIHDMFARGRLELQSMDDMFFDHFVSLSEYIVELDCDYTVDEIWEGLTLMGYTDNLDINHARGEIGAPVFSVSLIQKAIERMAKEKN